MFFDLPHTNNEEEVLCSLNAMRLQEEQSYFCEDYLRKQQVNIGGFMRQSFFGGMTPVDAECRQKMTMWCYQIVDFCKFNRETVAVAMSFLDRFLSTHEGLPVLVDRGLFQLAAMTCLYTAVKIHEAEAIEPKLIAGLSRGAYTEEEVTTMEATILKALGWKMNPPTPQAFIHHFMALIPSGAVTKEDREAVTELAKYQAELAMNDYSLICTRASSIALAAIVNAKQSLKVTFEEENELFDTLCKIGGVGNAFGLGITREKLTQALQSTSTSFFRSTSPSEVVLSKVVETAGEIHSSPRCVSSSH